jgi:hypothetical protein
MTFAFVIVCSTQHTSQSFSEAKTSSIESLRQLVGSVRNAPRWVEVV